MRTRFSPLCTSISATPLSTTSWTNSLISSFDISEQHQLLGCGRQDFAPVFRHGDGVLDPYASQTPYVSARFNCNHHSGGEFGLFLEADPGRLVNFQSQAVAR